MKQMMATMFLTTILLLPLPLFFKKLQTKTTLIIKTSFFTSLIPAMLAMKYQTQNTNMSFHLTSMGTTDIMMTITINKYSMLFLPTALLVTWSIMEFSTWYMTNEPKKIFQKYLLTFLISMTILATAGSFLQLLIGWEGVGVMSFMLINWWSTRTNANSAALQAIIYNRTGDMGLILAMVILMSDLGTWNIGPALSLNTKNTLISMGLIMAATGKSAQFFMHMWLPAAMEGPTPVSALLHSSTMVVAGIYMLAQMHPMMNTKHPMTACLLLGTTTSIYSALCALAQNDIKKIIAFSTSSQLGLMMIAIGINKPDLAMFHMITHATFKSTLFLCAGSMIHNTKNEQDIRKTNCTKTTLPMTTTLMTMNGLAIAGMPFLSGFYSKDAIIEAMMTNNNAWALMATIVTTTMTSSYTMRMMFYMTKKIFNYKPIFNQQEIPNHQTTPLIRLTFMAVMIGTVLTPSMSTTPVMLNTHMKMLPTIAIIIGTYLTTELLMTPKKSKMKSLKFISHLAFFKLLHRTIPLKTFHFSQKKSTQLTDLIWLENIGPTTMDTTSTALSNITSSQKGHVKKYFAIMLIAATMMLLTQLA